MPELLPPTVRLRDSWLAAYAEWEPGAHMEGAGLGADDDVDSPEGFAAWVERLRRCEDHTIPPEEGRVHTTYWWIAEGDTYLGAIDLRHWLNAFLLDAGGHIGYSVRPSARRRGLATWALGAALHEARTRGMDRVLVTCSPGNPASARTIERNGGVLEDVRKTLIGRKRRYWIDL
ncbi:GNAT family N-acetyltransferase [Streptomyces sp. NPDC006368]|uniref:GNAT family N-acetyltransferase n=1 Tax=Streptomyces sp. NPDC006368 TaxID=3156760 RepID=UPI0033A14795